MSGHFGRDITVKLLCSKLFFPNIKDKVSEFVNSCEACQCVKAGNKFDKGGEKLKSVPVPYQTMNQLGIDLVTNLPVTPEGYNTIVTAVDYTSKWVESRALKGNLLRVLQSSYMIWSVILELQRYTSLSRGENLLTSCVFVIHICAVN